MGELDAAVKERNWAVARRTCSAAWSEVEQLPQDLVRAERYRLWEAKHFITQGEDQDRRRRERAGGMVS
ncbi:hypothetical protein [Kitasatospora sp. NPDC004289]